MKTMDKKPASSPRIIHHGLSGMARSQASCVQHKQIGQILRNNSIQDKLSNGEPNDKYEQQADRVADEVMRMPDSNKEESIQAKPFANAISPLIQREPEPQEDEEIEAEKEREEKPIQTRPLSNKPAAVTAGLQSRIQSLRDRGQPLPGTERRFFEQRFGADFSHVRIHNNPGAARMAKSINARAFTQGSDVVFGKDEYAHGTNSCRRLIAHELTHVIQQHSGPQLMCTRLSIRNRHNEFSNNRVARWAISGNIAKSNKKSDTLTGLAKKVSGNPRDWSCIWIKRMKSKRREDKRYDRYIRRKDEFDISNLTLTTGPSKTFSYDSAAIQFRTMKAFYGGSDPGNDLDLCIQNLASDGKTPIQNLTLTGHTSSNKIWGDKSSFTASGLYPYQPVVAGGAYNKMGPRRGWFTRNATVRVVGCFSNGFAKAFAKIYLRKGAVAFGTTKWLCGWSGSRFSPALVMTIGSPRCDPKTQGRRYYTASDLNAAKGLWGKVKGRL